MCVVVAEGLVGLFDVAHVAACSLYTGHGVLDQGTGVRGQGHLEHDPLGQAIEAAHDVDLIVRGGEGCGAYHLGQLWPVQVGSCW